MTTDAETPVPQMISSSDRGDAVATSESSGEATPDPSGSEQIADTGEDSARPPHDLQERDSRRWVRVLTLAVLPAFLLLLGLAAGYLKWQDGQLREASVARVESVQAAKDITVAMLSYRPDTAEHQLGSARGLLTGSFRDSYVKLTTEVVVPGAKQQQIAATATVPAAASVSANPRHAVVLVFVDQSTTVGSGAPSETASSVRVTLDKVDGRWLVSQFDPI